MGFLSLEALRKGLESKCRKNAAVCLCMWRHTREFITEKTCSHFCVFLLLNRKVFFKNWAYVLFSRSFTSLPLNLVEILAIFTHLWERQWISIIKVFPRNRVWKIMDFSKLLIKFGHPLGHFFFFLFFLLVQCSNQCASLQYLLPAALSSVSSKNSVFAGETCM